jgi:hypothetical protein
MSFDDWLDAVLSCAPVLPEDIRDCSHDLRAFIPAIMQLLSTYRNLKHEDRDRFYKALPKALTDMWQQLEKEVPSMTEAFTQAQAKELGFK